MRIMKHRLSAKWQKVPRHVRRPIVLTFGMFFVLLAGAIGWLPGPGGIPIFLLGIAILSTEFQWADRLKRSLLGYVHSAGLWIHKHKAVSVIIGLSGLTLSSYILYIL